MNKQDFVKAVSGVSGLTQKESLLAVNGFIAAVTEILAKGESVTLVGFGKFCVKNRKERNGISPATKEKITIPAKKAPVFQAGKALKEMANAE